MNDETKIRRKYLRLFAEAKLAGFEGELEDWVECVEKQKRKEELLKDYQERLDKSFKFNE